MPRQSEKNRSDAELLQGTLDMLILKVVALRPIHGYAILQRIQQISKDALQLRQGSLYPALYRLEKRGWLEAEWRVHEGGRDAKYYKLTKAGRQQLTAETAGWETALPSYFASARSHGVRSRHYEVGFLVQAAALGTEDERRAAILPGEPDRRLRGGGVEP